MKKALWKKENILYVGLFILLVIVHFPLLTKNIYTADVLLNNSYYNGYSWEISLGRFGLWVVGVLKSYLSFPNIDLFLSFLLIGCIAYFLFQLFEVKEKVPRVFFILLMVLSPVISATLLFHYCSVAYLLAFLSGVLSVYFYYHLKNKYLKILLPILCIVLSLSMYQAYLSLIVTTFVIYQIKLLMDQKIKYKESGIYLLLLLCGVIIYFIGMKLSLVVFHVDMANYSNANSIGISTLLSFPQKFVDSYKLFYEFFFTNEIMKNTYLGNRVLHGVILILFMISYIYFVIKAKNKTFEKVLMILLLLLMPVFLNSVIFVISDAKLQLLMSASYLMLFLFILTVSYPKYLKLLICILMVCLFRNYLIQDQASYMTLENTTKAYKTIIQSAIDSHIHEPNKKYIVIGEMKNTDTNITNKNYGYIVDDGIFWEEYNLRKLGFERFCKQEFGLNIEFGEEETYQLALDDIREESLYKINDTIIINLYNY